MNLGRQEPAEMNNEVKIKVGKFIKSRIEMIYGEMTSGQNKSGSFEAVQAILRGMKEVEVKIFF